MLFRMLCVLGLGLSLSPVLGQNFNPVRRSIQALEEVSERDSLLISYPALHLFMARKVNKYLTGAGDLSLNKSYFTIDPADGRLFLGYNMAQDPRKSQYRNPWILTLGFKASLADAFSTIYTGQAWAPNMGGMIKITRLGRGVVRYDDRKEKQPLTNLYPHNKAMPDLEEEPYTQAQVASFYRAESRNDLERQMRSDSLALELRLAGVASESYRKQRRRDFYAAKNEAYRIAYLEQEADNLDNNQYYKSYQNHWWSLLAYVPFTRQQYAVASDLLSPLEAQSLYPFDVQLVWNLIAEHKKARYFLGCSAGARMLSNVGTAAVQQFTLGQYRVLGGQDTLSLAELQRRFLYVGQYEQTFSPYLRVQGVAFLWAEKQIGLSFLLEQYFFAKNPMNLRLGIPFSLAGKKDETKVTFELQLRWNDVTNRLFPDKKAKDKFLVGLSIGLPLVSKVY